MTQNTGFVRYQYLEEFILGTGKPTGQTKPNIPTDEDFAAPVYDVITCPLPVTGQEISNRMMIRIKNNGGQFLNILQLQVSPWDVPNSSNAIYNNHCLLLPGETKDMMITPVQQATDWINVNLVAGSFSKNFPVNIAAGFTNAAGLKQLGNIVIESNTGKPFPILNIARTAAGGTNLLEFVITDIPVTTTVNVPPVAIAGDDQLVMLSDDMQVQLNGSGTDSDGQVITYHWDKTMGPIPCHISDPNIPNPVLTGLVKGIYKFRLTVTDNRGAIGQSEVTITVDTKADSPNGTLVALVESTLTQCSITGIQLIPLNGGNKIDVLTAPVRAADGPVLATPLKGNYKLYVTIAGQVGAVKVTSGATSICQPFHGEGLYIFHDVTIGEGARGLALTLTSGSCNNGENTSVFAKLITTGNITVEEAILPLGKKRVEQAEIKAVFYADLDATTKAPASLLLNYRVETKNLLTGIITTLDTYTEVTNQDHVVIGGNLSETIYNLTLPVERQIEANEQITYSLLPGVGYRLL